MKVVVTGGCGYVGSALVPRLAERATSVDVLDIDVPRSYVMAQVPPSVRFHQMDVAEESRVRPIVKDADLIIHLAALVGYPACNKAPELAARCNVGTTKSLLRAKGENTRLLFASTCSNYGAQEGLVTESTPLNPTSLYGTTKVQSERLVRKDDKNIVFRFAGGFGVSPNTRDDLLIHDFCSKAVFGIPLSVYESHFVRQFIHVSDMVGAILFAVDNWDRMRNQVFNVGNPAVEITKRDLVEAIARHLTFDHKFENSGSDLEKRNYPVSFAKLQRVGFSPKFALDTGISELVQYYGREKIRRAEQVRRPGRAAA